MIGKKAESLFLYLSEQIINLHFNNKISKMKTQILLAAFLCFATSLFAQTSITKEEVKVSGNCNSCKKNIETAAKAAGASTAIWNKDTKILLLSFDAAKTSDKKIQEKIASVGYDTQDVTATDAAYEKLDNCCQYDRKAQKSPKKE